MKFFESKYYVPYKESKERDPAHQVTLDIIAARSRRGGNTLTSDILAMYCERMPVITNWRVDINRICKEWVLVDDLTKITRYGREGILGTDDHGYMFNKVYFHPESETFAYYVGRNVDEDGLEYDGCEFTTKLYLPLTVNHQAAVKILVSEGYFLEYENKAIPNIGILARDNRGLAIKYSKLRDVAIDFENMYPAGFTEASDAIVSHLCDEGANGLIILHGLPGTGKTNYIRWLSGVAKRRLVYIPTEMTNQLTSPQFVDFLLEHKGLTFILEDAEASLSSRMGSERSIVSGILNLTDGLLGDVLRCQFICTFNTELSNVDKALLRPGRLLVRQEFTKLTVDDANKYLRSVDSDVIATEAMSLAELTNIKTPSIINSKTKQTGIGFTANI